MNKTILDMVIFDMDGTFIDGSIVHANGCKEAISHAGEKHNLSLEGKTLEEILEMQKGRTHTGFAEILVENSNLKDIPNLDAIISGIASVKEKYVQAHSDDVRLYEDIKPALKELKKAGVKTALFTSADKVYTRAVLEKYGLKFDYVLDGDEIVKLGMKPKPAPDGVYAILNKLGISYDKEVAFVGDGDSDCQSAQAAKEKVKNLRFILYSPDNKTIQTPLEERDKTIRSHGDLLKSYKTSTNENVPLLHASGISQ